MNAEEFVKNFYKEKQDVLNGYFNEDEESEAGVIIYKLIDSGVHKDVLYRLVESSLIDTYYTILLGLDGEANIGGTQMTYKIYDEDDNLINECGEIEEKAYEYFQENEK